MQVNLTARPPARPLADIITDSRLADCGRCLQVAGLPCSMRRDGAQAVHVGRVAAAWRKGLISGADLAAALAVPAVFATSTLIWAGRPMSAPERPELTAVQRFSVEEARVLIASTPQDIYAAAFPGEPEPMHGQDYAYAWGRLKPFVETLLEIVDEQHGGTDAS